jgi:RNA-binding protein
LLRDRRLPGPFEPLFEPLLVMATIIPEHGLHPRILPLQCHLLFSGRPEEPGSSQEHHLESAKRKELRKIAHHLHPVILIGDGGVSDAVIAETNRALDDHELIKVKVNALDRDDRSRMIDALIEACQAEAIQRIGKVAIIYRRNPEAKPELSNITRAGR